MSSAFCVPSKIGFSRTAALVSPEEPARRCSWQTFCEAMGEAMDNMCARCCGCGSGYRLVPADDR